MGIYEYDLLYRPGHLHTNADTMSRKPKRLCPYPECKDCTPQKYSTNEQKLPENKTESEKVNVIPHETDSNSLPNWLQIWSNDELKELQSQDVVTKEILRLKESSNNKPEKSAILHALRDVITLWNQ